MSTPRPSQKKQATLTSFFTPKSGSSQGNGNALPSSSPVQSQSQSQSQSQPSQTKSKSRPVQPPPSQSLPSRKRPLEDEVDQNRSTNGGGARSRFARAVKRAKGESSGEENEENEEEDKDGGDDDFVPEVEKDKEDMETEKTKTASTATATQASSPLRSSGRAERYIYDEKRSQRTENGQSQDDNDKNDSSSDSDDAETKRKKAELHRKFVKKLGHPDSMSKLRRRGGDDEPKEDGEGGEEDGEGDDDEEDRPKPTAGKKKAPGKLTPGDQQFLAIKRKHLDTLLVVEVGYKFRIYGEDARTAARTLGIMCVPGKMRYDEHPSEAHLDRFASASFPVPRLPVHVKRLVAAGHKVGVVRQMETAALKKVGDNRNAPFTRQLTNVYTKGTYVDEADLTESTTTTTSAGYLLCLTEKSAGGLGTDEKVNVGLLAVQPATGDILYDSFDDGFMRNEIETRLLHIAPCELLLVGELSRATEKLVQHLSGSASNVFGDRTRVERVAASAQADAQTHVTQFYADSLARVGKTDESQETADESESETTETTENRAKLLETVLGLPSAVTVCLSAMITHLTEYGLQHIFDLTKYFAAFSTRQHMLLNGTTLESLEVYRNATDHGLRGSLLWALDKTTTRPGHRLLRKWIGRPLLDRRPLEARVAAVEELLASDGAGRREKLELLLTNTHTTDLERSLIRIYYGKCTRPELVAVLQTLQRISSAYISTVASTSAAAVEFSPNGFKSPLIRDALHSLPAIHDTVVLFLEKINGDAARKDDKYAFFREAEETDDIANYKVGILAVEMELEEHRAEIAATLNKKPAYVTVAGIEYLVEVLNTDIRRVPASWIKVSGTKKASRFHTPTVVRLIRERDQHKEALAAACDAAFAALLADLAACYQPLRDAVASLATLDCLLSLARVAAMPGYSKPTLLPTDGDDDTTPATLDIQGGRHPVAEHTLPSGYIPFTAKLGGGGRRLSTSDSGPDSIAGDAGPLALLITGPNMGGKSSFVRAVALLTLMAQIGSYVPADAMRLTLADAIFTRMGARDNLFAGESTFMVEVSETAAILRAATPRSLVVLDELGRGTSTHDGAAIAQAVLAHVATGIKCLTLFITHYQNLGRVAEGLGPPRGVVQNVHMRFTATQPSRETAKPARVGAATSTGNEGNGGESDDTSAPAPAPAAFGDGDGDGAEEITFLYEVGRGMAHRSYGLNVARLARIPQRVLDVAATKSREMEEDVRVRRLQAAVRLAADVLSTKAASTNSTEDQLDHLISSIEQL